MHGSHGCYSLIIRRLASKIDINHFVCYCWSTWFFFFFNLTHIMKLTTLSLLAIDYILLVYSKIGRAMNSIHFFLQNQSLLGIWSDENEAKQIEKWKTERKIMTNYGRICAPRFPLAITFSLPWIFEQIYEYRKLSRFLQTTRKILGQQPL